MKAIIVLLMVAVLLVSGCVAPTVPEAGEPEMDNISGEISDIDTLIEDLNMSELENLESELDELTW